MTKIIKFPTGNNDNTVVIDGEEYHKYEVRYSLDGQAWAIEMWATSMEDAWSRIYSIRYLPVEIDMIEGEISQDG